MEESFLSANMISFDPVLPFKRVENLANCNIISEKKNKYISFEMPNPIYSTKYIFKIDYKSMKKGQFPFYKKELFVENIFNQDEFNHFAREAMFLMTYLLIKDTEFRIELFTDISDYDLDSYNFLDIKNNYSHSSFFKDI